MERLQRHFSGTCVCFTMPTCTHQNSAFAVRPAIRSYIRYASAVPGLLRLPALVSPAADADFFSRAL